MSDEHNLDTQLQNALRREKLDRTGKKIVSKGGENDSSGWAFGMRMGMEFLGGTLVGLGIGLGLDHLFNSKPWCTLIFLILGFGAGILNMYRLFNSMDDTIGLNRQDYLTKEAQTGTSEAGQNPPHSTP